MESFPVYLLFIPKNLGCPLYYRRAQATHHELGPDPDRISSDPRLGGLAASHPAYCHTDRSKPVNSLTLEKI